MEKVFNELIEITIESLMKALPPEWAFFVICASLQFLSVYIASRQNKLPLVLVTSFFYVLLFCSKLLVDDAHTATFLILLYLLPLIISGIIIGIYLVDSIFKVSFCVVMIGRPFIEYIFFLVRGIDYISYGIFCGFLTGLAIDALLIGFTAKMYFLFAKKALPQNSNNLHTSIHAIIIDEIKLFFSWFFSTKK